MCLYVFNRYRLLLLGVAALIVTAMLGSPAVRAQGGDREVAFADAEVPFQLSDDAASVPDSLGYHILPANTEAGKNALLNGPVGQVKTQASASVKPLAGLAQPGFFPADLSYFGGLWVKSGSSANIYYNCANQSCWGNPEGFLTDLAASKFIHVVDQYIGSKANNRYPLSLASTVHLSGGSSSLTSTDIESMVHQAVVQVGAGHIFHLFLPQGVRRLRRHRHLLFARQSFNVRILRLPRRGNFPGPWRRRGRLHRRALPGCDWLRARAQCQRISKWGARRLD